MALHIKRACIIFTAAMAGIDLRKRREGFPVRLPVFPPAAQLVGHMVGDGYRRPVLIRLIEFLVPHGMEHWLFIIQKEHIMVSVLSGALPLIAHKHRITGFVLLFYRLAELFPVLFNLFPVI